MDVLEDSTGGTHLSGRKEGKMHDASIQLCFWELDSARKLHSALESG